MTMSGVDVAAWRRLQRPALIAAREALPEARRHEHAALVDALLAGMLAMPAKTVIAFCWPHRAEVDPRFAVRRLRDAGIDAALPVVAAKGQPLQFRRWWPGVAMVRGALDIPYPRDTELVTPHLALVPLVGFDAQGYRLGYGGGYFDRTLAALPIKPVCVGVGFELARLDTIHPQPHDVPMDFIVTEAGIGVVADRRLRAASPAEAAQAVTALARQRGLW
jgi:5-formyltetrahydrofolate cyclo-ligase